MTGYEKKKTIQTCLNKWIVKRKVDRYDIKKNKILFLNVAAETVKEVMIIIR